MTGESASPSRIVGRKGKLLLPILALTLSLGVLLLNRGPLFYIDSGGYLAMGKPLLERVLGSATVEEPKMAGGTPAMAGGSPPARETGQVAEDPERKTIGGMRSNVYAAFMALFWRLGSLSALPVVNTLSLFLAAWLPARVIAREYGPPHLTARLVAIPLIAGAAGALPFYVAFLMPDIFAPVLIIVIATLTVFGRRMERGEILLALALGSFAVVVHLSHLAIALALLPVSALAAVLVSRRRWWLPPALVLAIGAVGILHVKGFEVAAEVVAEKSVIYHPQVTARLIVNGPGYDYLEENCPDPEIATCLLWDALAKSDDPWRLTSSHIIFSMDPRLGSYRLMPPEGQQRVAEEQREFFLRVLADRPVATTASFARNTLTQMVFFSIDMTIPTQEDMELVRRNPALGDASAGELAAGRAWIDPLTRAHTVVYAVSFVVLVGMLMAGRRNPGDARLFALMLLVGVLTNAFICGALSQPATRYGGRVIWLLPFAAAFLVTVALACPGAARARRDAAGHGALSREPDRQRT